LSYSPSAILIRYPSLLIVAGKRNQREWVEGNGAMIMVLFP
jgi:hypothetical protein